MITTICVVYSAIALFFSVNSFVELEENRDKDSASKAIRNGALWPGMLVMLLAIDE